MDEIPEYPEVVYLKKHIWIKGIEIGHTKAGLKWLIYHYKNCLKFNGELNLTGRIRTDEDHAFMLRMIENLELHLQLYELYGNETNSNGIQQA